MTLQTKATGSHPQHFIPLLLLVTSHYILHYCTQCLDDIHNAILQAANLTDMKGHRSASHYTMTPPHSHHPLPPLPVLPALLHSAVTTHARCVHISMCLPHDSIDAVLLAYTKLHRQCSHVCVLCCLSAITSAITASVTMYICINCT